MNISIRNSGDSIASNLAMARYRGFWFLVALVVVFAVACGQEPPPNTPTRLSPPTAIPTATVVGGAMGIIAPPPVTPGTPRPQSWRIETAVGPIGSGTIEFSPPQPDRLYFLGTTVELTANCDFDFVRWEGSVPKDADKTANPLTITMEGPTVIFAICTPAP